MSFTNETKIILRRLFKLLKPYIKKLSVIFICSVASAGISMLFPLLSKQIMDKGLLSDNFSVVVRFSLFTFALVLVNHAIGFLETKYFSYVNSI